MSSGTSKVPVILGVITTLAMVGGLGVLGFIAIRGSLSRGRPSYPSQSDWDRQREEMLSQCNAGLGGVCADLGVHYAMGRGVPRDMPRAAALYQKACDAAHAQGCLNLAKLCESGRGVDRDPAKARALRKRSCQLRGRDDCE